MTTTFQVLGVGLWTRHHEGVARWPEGNDIATPKARLIPALLRRRLSVLSAAMVDAIADAVEEPTRLGELPTVFGSAYGETAVLVDILNQITSPGGNVSPVAFASSVHNTASGNVSIATGNRGFTTSLGAGHDTVAAALFEAFGLMLAGTRDECLIVVGDQEEPEALVPADECAPLLAAAIHVGKRAHPARPALATISMPIQTPVVTPVNCAPFVNNPCVGALSVIDAIVGRRSGPVALDGGRGLGYAATIACESYR